MSRRSNGDLNTANYRMMPFFSDPNASNNDRFQVDVESAMIRGMPQHTTKSYGYRNPSENYFQYDIENQFAPDAPGLVEDWVRGGIATRNSNKVTARPRGNREIF